MPTGVSNQQRSCLSSSPSPSSRCSNPSESLPSWEQQQAPQQAPQPSPQQPPHCQPPPQVPQLTLQLSYPAACALWSMHLDRPQYVLPHKRTCAVCLLRPALSSSCLVSAVPSLQIGQTSVCRLESPQSSEHACTCIPVCRLPPPPRGGVGGTGNRTHMIQTHSL